MLKNPENRTTNQDQCIELIASTYPGLYKAYELKEALRQILHMTDPEMASKALDIWIRDCAECGIDKFTPLAEKIQRHKEAILNTLRLHMSNARIEADNSKIKLVIRKACGFRNIENMKDMIMLVCSNIKIPRLHHEGYDELEERVSIRTRKKSI